MENIRPALTSQDFFDEKEITTGNQGDFFFFLEKAEPIVSKMVRHIKYT